MRLREGDTETAVGPFPTSSMDSTASVTASITQTWPVEKQGTINRGPRPKWANGGVGGGGHTWATPMRSFRGAPVSSSDVSYTLTAGGVRLTRYMRVPSAENVNARESAATPDTPIPSRK